MFDGIGKIVKTKSLVSATKPLDTRTKHSPLKLSGTTQSKYLCIAGIELLINSQLNPLSVEYSNLKVPEFPKASQRIVSVCVGSNPSLPFG